MSILSKISALFGVSTDQSATGGYRRISGQEAREMLKSDPKAKLVDVRTEGEYRARHIPGSILITDMVLGENAPKLLPDKEAVIIVHCQSGMRSRRAAHKLLSMGYTNVYDLGGIMNWPQ